MKKYLKSLVKVVGYAAVFVLVPYVLVFIMNLSDNGLPGAIKDLLKETPSTGFGMISFMSLVVYFIISKVRKRSFIDDFDLYKMDKQSNIDSILIAALMGVFSMCLVSTAYVSKNFTDLMDTMKFFYLEGSVIPIFLSAVLIGPAFEEFIFRGIVFKELNKWTHLIPALLIQTFLYSLVQPNLQASVYGFVGGIAFAWVYMCSRSLWSSIIVQTASCFFMFIYIRLDIYSVLSQLNDFVLFSISTLSGIAIIFVLIKMLKRSKREGLFQPRFEEESAA